MFEFPCPYCSTTLRLRDQSLRNRVIQCPDCQQSVAISGSAGKIIGTKVDNSSPASTSSLPQSNQPQTGLSPVMIVSIIVAIVVLVGIIMNSQPVDPPEPTQTDSTPDDQEMPVDHEDGNDASPNTDTESVQEQLEVKVPQKDAVSERLDKIHELIDSYLDQHGAYPRAIAESKLPAEDRLSWIAVVDHDVGNSSMVVDWEQPWNASANDRFTRRWLSEFENPDLNRAVGDDQRPASHFVGITGYGDAPEHLPKDHPRAGVFGVNRETRIEDITDGLANTMLVADVTSNFGSWAKSSSATTRGFTQSPYINGPDGFGNADGVHALMADGSVKLLSADTNPVIVERMAAMADGLPLDATIAARPKMNPPEPDTQQDRQSDEAPILVPMVTGPPPFDLQQHMQNRVAAYQQTKPTSLKIVLFEMEELIGISIQSSSLTEEQLAQEITLDQTNVTLQELLNAVLDAADLQAEFKTRSILIQPR